MRSGTPVPGWDRNFAVLGSANEPVLIVERPSGRSFDLILDIVTLS